MNSTIIIPLFSGAFGALLVALITIHHQRKVFVGTLKEKWICELRNEMAQLVEMSENLRLLWRELNVPAATQEDFDRQKKTGLEILALYHTLVGKRRKIHMLLNDDPEQTELYTLVDKLVKMADGASSMPSKYEEEEEKVIQAARKLLRKQWHAISRIHWPKAWKVVLVFLEIILFSGLVFLEIQQEEEKRCQLRTLVASKHWKPSVSPCTLW